MLSSRESDPSVCCNDVDMHGPALPVACSVESDDREEGLEGRLPSRDGRDQCCRDAAL